MAIRAVVGDNGVLSQATKSSDKSKYKAEIELAEMQIEYITEGENIGKIDIPKTIDNINALDEVEEAIMDSGTIVVSFKDGKTYDIVIPKANITDDNTGNNTENNTETNEFELILIANADPDGTNTTSQEEMNFYNKFVDYWNSWNQIGILSSKSCNTLNNFVSGALRDTEFSSDNIARLTYALDSMGDFINNNYSSDVDLESFGQQAVNIFNHEADGTGFTLSIEE